MAHSIWNSERIRSHHNDIIHVVSLSAVQSCPNLDGRVLGCGSAAVDSYNSCPLAAPAHEDFVSISAGNGLTCGLLEDGASRCCEWRCLHASPSTVLLVLPVRLNATLTSHFAFRSGWTGGDDLNEQLGDGSSTTNFSAIPVAQRTYSTFTEIAASGMNYACGLISTCTVPAAPLLNSVTPGSNGSVTVGVAPPTTTTCASSDLAALL